MYREKITKMITAATKEYNIVNANIYKELKTAFINYESAKNAKSLDDAAADIAYDLAKIFQKCIYNKDGTLPNIPTKEDIASYIITTYPEGIEKKQMGKVIKEIKSKFLGVDGKMVADLVKTQLTNS
jgi:uncharacterized protein YqeY